ATVEDHSIICDDWLAQAVRLDVGDERVELLALHQREDVGERMKLEAIAVVGRRGYIRHCLWLSAGVALQRGPAFSLPSAGLNDRKGYYRPSSAVLGMDCSSGSFAGRNPLHDFGARPSLAAVDGVGITDFERVRKLVPPCESPTGCWVKSR